MLLFESNKNWIYPLSKINSIDTISVVCAIRLDFETFTLLGTAGTDETMAADVPCLDSFTITVRYVII